MASGEALVRRLVDVMLAGGALLCCVPVLGLAAIGIKLSSPGPICYRARRIGRHGREFTMYKLRTMHVATASAQRRITAQQDERIFPFGAWLRRTKLDELPQCWNILRGEMAVIGPRAEDPVIVAQHYTAAQRETLTVRPGLSSPGSLYYYTHGEAQLAGDAAESYYLEQVLPLKLALDTIYLRKASLGGDLRVMARTVVTILGILLGKQHFADPVELPEARRLLAEQAAISE